MSSYQWFQDPPKIRKVKHRGRFHLKCTAQANYPPPLITWKLDNGPEILGMFSTSLHCTDRWCTFRIPGEIILRLSQSGRTTDICPVHSSVPTHTWRQGICLECTIDYSSRGGQGGGDVLRPPSGTLHTASQGFCHTQRWKGWVRLVHLKLKKTQQQKLCFVEFCEIPLNFGGKPKQKTRKVLRFFLN